MADVRRLAADALHSAMCELALIRHLEDLILEGCAAHIAY
jgi:hypothetical protein